MLLSGSVEAAAADTSNGPFDGGGARSRAEDRKRRRGCRWWPQEPASRRRRSARAAVRRAAAASGSKRVENEVVRAFTEELDQGRHTVRERRQLIRQERLATRATLRSWVDRLVRDEHARMRRSMIDDAAASRRVVEAVEKHLQVPLADRLGPAEARHILRALAHFPERVVRDPSRDVVVVGLSAHAAWCPAALTLEREHRERRGRELHLCVRPGRDGHVVDRLRAADAALARGSHVPRPEVASVSRAGLVAALRRGEQVCVTVGRCHVVLERQPGGSAGFADLAAGAMQVQTGSAAWEETVVLVARPEQLARLDPGGPCPCVRPLAPAARGAGWLGVRPGWAEAARAVRGRTVRDRAGRLPLPYREPATR